MEAGAAAARRTMEDTLLHQQKLVLDRIAQLAAVVPAAAGVCVPGKHF